MHSILSLKRLAALLAIAYLCTLSITQAATVSVTENITTDTTWTADNEYILTDIIFVTDGATLTIEPGTTIKAEPKSVNAFDPGTLVITRGSKIMAQGTAAAPIVFTSTLDDGTLTNIDTGLWGGIIILGNAVINTQSGENFIEGLEQSELGLYGGNDDADSSGVMRYVSIRHGGTNLASDNEINGLTMGAVGSGTTIEFIEVFANLDDGYEWFGGSVNTCYLISAFCGDDAFDFDEGFRGTHQFWFAIQNTDADGGSGEGGEQDGGTDPEDGVPFSTPMIYNATFIGGGETTGKSGNDGFNIRDNSAVNYFNSIFTDFRGNAFNGIEDLESGEDSRARLDAGDLNFRNNIFFGFGAGNTIEALAPQEHAQILFTDQARDNQIVDPQLGGISRSADGGLNPLPLAGSPALTTSSPAPGNGILSPAVYKGAFNDTNWAAGWTNLSSLGFLSSADGGEPILLSGSGDIAGENIQHPNGNVFDQVLLTGQSIQLQANAGQITRVSFMDEDEDIVQVEFSGAGTLTVNLDPASFLPAALPPRYNQEVEYVTGKPSVVIEGADSSTFFSIFTVGSINAVNQALFPEGQVYDAEADVTLVEVINSTGMGGMQLSNTVFSGSTGKVGVDARGVPIAVRLTIGDIDASGDAVPHLLFGTGSFTVAASNPGLRITGGDLAQTNGASIIVAQTGSMIPGFETVTTQNNFKSDSTPQPTQSLNASFVNEDDTEITVNIIEVTID